MRYKFKISKYGDLALYIIERKNYKFNFSVYDLDFETNGSHWSFQLQNYNKDKYGHITCELFPFIELGLSPKQFIEDLKFKDKYVIRRILTKLLKLYEKQYGHNKLKEYNNEIQNQS